MKYPIAPSSHWYHGSPHVLTELACGSTITQWKALAVAFSHKPRLLQYHHIHGNIRHTGRLPGFLYQVSQPILPEDVTPHPNSSMEEGVEWLTTRPLPLRRIGTTEMQVDNRKSLCLYCGLLLGILGFSAFFTGIFWHTKGKRSQGRSKNSNIHQ